VGLAVLLLVAENVSHCAAEMCRRTNMHVTYSPSGCQWYISEALADQVRGNLWDWLHIGGKTCGPTSDRQGHFEHLLSMFCVSYNSQIEMFW
jgi:hypothetical protein